MGSKKNQKIVKRKENPPGKKISRKEEPDAYYSEYPAWHFAFCDKDMWPFAEENAGELFWKEILPFLQNLEKRQWRDILVNSKKQNHSINASELSTKAQKRLTELPIEAESIISLRLTGTHRIYGYIIGRVFNIIWFDKNHGDNGDCVCRSHMRNT